MDFDDLVKEKEIDLSHRGLRDCDLDVLVKVLQKSKVLEELDLRCNQITLSDGKFTNALANNCTLQRLFIYYNNIGPEGAKKLAAALKINKTLQGLYLSFDKIGDEGSKSIADALMNNGSLQVLGLENNNIGDEGATSLAASFLVNQSLRKIWLNRNHISDEGGEKLADALQYNCAIEEFELRGNDSISRKVLNKIEVILKDPTRKAKHAHAQNSESELKQLRNDIASKEDKISSLQKEIDDKNAEISIKYAAVTLKDEELASKDEEIASKDVELAMKTAAILSKDQEISSLQSENGQLKEKLKHSKPIETIKLTGLGETTDDFSSTSPPYKRLCLKQDNQVVGKSSFALELEIKKERKEREGVSAKLVQVEQRLVQVKCEKEEAKYNAEMARMLSEALVMEKEHLESGVAFAGRVAHAAMIERNDALLATECPLCMEVGLNFMAFVPCGHGMCTECILKHSHSRCHTCTVKVRSLLRLRK